MPIIGMEKSATTNLLKTLRAIQKNIHIFYDFFSFKYLYAVQFLFLNLNHPLSSPIIFFVYKKKIRFYRILNVLYYLHA